MLAAHRVIGWIVVASFAVVLATSRLGKSRPDLYERAALTPFAVVVAQGLLGLILRIQGRRPSGLHVFYGVAAFIVYLAGVGLARALQRDRWVVFAWASGVAGALALRALMTG